MHDDPLFQYERELFGQGHTLIAGVDEAGRGPLAGPVVAAAVILPVDFFCEDLNDSKKLTASLRDEIFTRLVEDEEVDYGVGVVGSVQIDELNILGATFEAMRNALGQLTQNPEYVLVDGKMRIPGVEIRQRAIVRGDSLSGSIAAGSIIAKVTRDRMMEDFHQQYPEYGFDKHKGYGTRRHMEMLETHGTCPIHRKSFAPCRGNQKELRL
jgi:ribonuclease HII